MKLKMIFIIHFIFFVIMNSYSTFSKFEEIRDNIYYPQSKEEIKYLNVFKSSSLSDNELITLQTLSGILAQNSPRIYIYYSDKQQDMWLKEIENNFNVQLSWNYQGLRGMIELIKIHREEILGYYIVDFENKNSIQAAISLCGIKQSIAIDRKLVNEIIQHFRDLHLFGNLMNSSPDSILDEYLKSGKGNKKIAFHIKPELHKFLTQYAISVRAFVFHDNFKSIIYSKIAESLEKGAAFFGWGEEEDMVLRLSTRSFSIHASDFSNNLHVSVNLNKSKLKKYMPKDISNNNANTNKHTVCFLMSDGDNLQWLQNSFFDERWYGNLKRGTFPVSWTISSSIVDLQPEIYNYIMQTRTDNDTFVSAPSGEGYNFPSVFPDYSNYSNRMKKFMQRFGMSTVNLLDSSDAKEEDIKSVLNTLTIKGDYNLTGVFYYPYSNYAGWKGKIEFHNNVPVIGGRFRLWEDFNDPKQLAEKLNTASLDNTSEDGYSLIPVHVWSMDFNKVLETYNLLGDNVEVVTVEEFVRRITFNIPH